jgi:hypothetical protein
MIANAIARAQGPAHLAFPATGTAVKSANAARTGDPGHGANTTHE